MSVCHTNKQVEQEEFYILIQINVDEKIREMKLKQQKLRFYW